MQVKIDKYRLITAIFCCTFLVWLALSYAYYHVVDLRAYVESTRLIAIVEIFMDVVIVMLAIKAVFKIPATDKPIWYALAISFVCLLLTDSLFYYSFPRNPNLWQKLSFLLPYFVFLLSQAYVWMALIHKVSTKITQEIALHVLGILFAIILSVIFIQSSSWVVAISSIQGWYDIATGFMQFYCNCPAAC